MRNLQRCTRILVVWINRCDCRFRVQISRWVLQYHLHNLFHMSVLVLVEFFHLIHIGQMSVITKSSIFATLTSGDNYWCWSFFQLLFASCAFMHWSPVLTCFVFAVCCKWSFQREIMYYTYRCPHHLNFLKPLVILFV